jgi:hypothetical protein
MSLEEKKIMIIKAYPGGDWVWKVEKMSEAQIHAIYNSLLKNNRLKG